MLQEFVFDRVLAEPGDGAQPPGHGSAGPPERFHLAGEGLDVGPAREEQRRGPGAAPAGELAHVQGVRVARQAAVAGQEPGERMPFGAVKAGWIMTRALDRAVVVGHLPAGLEPGGAGPVAGPSS